jgi:chemotaxis signal transduction protein
MSAVLSSKRTQSVERASVDIIRCGASADVYCLEMAAVANVKPAGDLRAYRGVEPNDPVGFIEHRGREAPVFDLPDLLGLPHQPTQEGHYVVLIDHPIQRYGLRVESVSRVIRVARESVLPLPKPLEHVGRCFRGIVDFTRDQKVSLQTISSRHLPGISEPKQAPTIYRRSKHQMQLLLSPYTLLPGHEAKPGPAIPAEFLFQRHASVVALSRTENARQLVLFPAGVIADRQLLIGLSISQVVEVSEPLTMVSIPGASPRILGFVHWRKCPVPVINLQASLHCEADRGAATHLLIVRDHHSDGLIALPVTGRVQSLRLPIEHRPCPLPDESWGRYVLGAFELEERLLILPRLEALSGLTP